METKDAEGQTVKKPKASEDVFLSDFYQFYIDKYAQYYVQYLKFRELVTVSPLMPDRDALNAIDELQKVGAQNATMLEETEAQVDEEINNIKDEARDDD